MATQHFVIGYVGLMYLLYTIQASVRRTAESISKYNCFRTHSCDYHGQPVCGYDKEDETVAKFENECTLFKVNCDGKGKNLFIIVDDNICETKVIPETTRSTTLTSPTVDYYYDLVDHTSPETSTHFWQDALMLGKRVTRVGSESREAALRDDPRQHTFPAHLMTLVMRY